MRAMATTKVRLDKHDKQIAAIRNLVQAGMKMLAENQRLGSFLSNSSWNWAATSRSSLDRSAYAQERNRIGLIGEGVAGGE